MKKEKASLENLSGETKLYLREVFTVLRAHWTLLSRGGMSHGRSSIGFINELSLDAIKLLVRDDEFLYSPANDDIDPYQYLWDKERELKENQIKFSFSIMPWQKEMLTKLRVVLEWGWEITNEKHDQGSYRDTFIGKGIRMVGSMLDPLVDGKDVSKIYGSIKSNPKAIQLFVRKLEFEIKDRK